MDSLRQLALIGPTASGKTALAVKIAKAYDAHILSIDSLSIYKEIDIVSAKPTLEEREGIVHFGIDHLYPNEDFDVTTFIALYRKAYAQCLHEDRSLVIVGGTSFYLKMLIEGISPLPPLNDEAQTKTAESLHDLTAAHEMLNRIDPRYMQGIEPRDRYRIEKALQIYYATGETPSNYFAKHPPVPVIEGDLPIYQIVWERSLLRKRIALRTKQMVSNGLIDEVCRLETKYTRTPHCMKAIGIKETLAYLDGDLDKLGLIEKITTNTARLAKRQETFNRSQLTGVVRADTQTLEKMLLK